MILATKRLLIKIISHNVREIIKKVQNQVVFMIEEQKVKTADANEVKVGEKFFFFWGGGLTQRLI